MCIATADFISDDKVQAYGIASSLEHDEACPNNSGSIIQDQFHDL